MLSYIKYGGVKLEVLNNNDTFAENWTYYKFISSDYSQQTFNQTTTICSFMPKLAE